jgi:hypothetical protein
MILKCRYCQKIYFADTKLGNKNQLMTEDKYLVPIGIIGGKYHYCPQVTSHMGETSIIADLIGFSEKPRLGAEVLYRPDNEEDIEKAETDKEKENND